MKMVIAAALAFCPGVAQSQALDLHLICRGSGASDFGNSATATTHNWNTGETVQTTVSGGAPRGFDDDVRIDVAGEGGRIRLPQALMPLVHGGKDGWFDLRKVNATSEEITATASINLLNKIKLRVDRVSGMASFTTKDGAFRGRCVSYRPEQVERAF